MFGTLPRQSVPDASPFRQTWRLLQPVLSERSWTEYNPFPGWKNSGAVG